MNYILIIMGLLIIYIYYLSRENKQLNRRASAELRYEIARRQLDEWNEKYGRLAK
jgi:hypothetical protein